MSNASVKLAVGGAVQAKNGTYLQRPVDEELFTACEATEFSYILASRQIGKSSLMVETAKKLSKIGIRTAVIDLNGIGQVVTADEWYFSLIDVLARKLKLSVDVQAWWNARPALSAILPRFMDFLREVVLEQIDAPVVIFIDEIDVTLGLPFTDDFFAAIRTVYSQRTQDPNYHRLTFVLLGVATPDDLIKDHNRTPFNIGRGIMLRDFTQAELAPFRRELKAAYPRQGETYFKQVYGWTNGHPFLTQKLCQAVLNAATADEPELIDRLVNELFLAPETRSDDNIQHLQVRVTTDPYAQAMLRVYRRVFEAKQDAVENDQSPVINRLLLYGLVVEEQGRLKVRNKIYAHAFDLAWANEMLSSIRLGLPEKYTVLRRLGQRGFTTVYLAQDQEVTDNGLVALKVLKVPEDAREDSTQWLERLQRKAHLLTEIDHPHIVKILESGRINSRTLYVAMEYIAGGNLREQFKERPMSRDEAVEMARQIATALEYVHDHDILHMVVNPNDILLDNQQEPQRWVLSDFGFTKFLLEEPHSQIQHDYIMLTPLYVAPEQGQVENLTPSADIYSLAVTFFEVLAGQLPADRQTGQPLPALSLLVEDLGPYFDEILSRATALDPAERFSCVADFIEALEAANQTAEEVEQTEQKMRAATVVDATQNYIEKGRYDPAKALSMIDVALEIYPDYLDALLLRGRIRLKQKQVDQALADFKAAYEQKQDPTSVVGREYLTLLSRTADDYWQRRAFSEAVRYYETIWQILDGRVDGDESVQKIWETAWSRLVEHHMRGAEEVYSLTDPDDIDQVVAILLEKIALLTVLKAEPECADLKAKVKKLQITNHTRIIAGAEARITALDTQEHKVRFRNEEIFQHYQALDEAYCALIELEPDNEQWSDKRHQTLKEQAGIRSNFAFEAQIRAEPDNEAALRHFEAIREIEKDYPGLAGELNLDLNKLIADLKTKVDHAGKYQEIKQLIAEQAYEPALERLRQSFIKTDHYEYRQVPQLLWKAVYAKQNEGRLPPEFEAIPVLERIKEQLLPLKQARIRPLKDKLTAWSETNIERVVEHELQLLRGYRDEIRVLENVLQTAETHKLFEKASLVALQQELVELGRQRETQRDTLDKMIGRMREMARKSAAWLDEIAQAEAVLEDGNSIKTVPEFLDKIETVRQAIEADPLVNDLEALISKNAEIEARVDHLKQQLGRQSLEILLAHAAEPGYASQELEKVKKEYRLVLAAFIPALFLGGAITLLALIVLMPDRYSQSFGLVVGLMVVAFVLFWGGVLVFRFRR